MSFFKRSIIMALHDFFFVALSKNRLFAIFPITSANPLQVGYSLFSFHAFKVSRESLSKISLLVMCPRIINTLFLILSISFFSFILCNKLLIISVSKDSQHPSACPDFCYPNTLFLSVRKLSTLHRHIGGPILHHS